MPEQIFQLVERNLEARRITAENIDELADWIGGYRSYFATSEHPTVSESESHFGRVGEWIVKLFDETFIFVHDEAFRKHFTSPRLPWHPQPPMPHWYRGPSFTDGPPLTINVKP
jgi:hypothetical protein